MLLFQYLEAQTHDMGPLQRVFPLIIIMSLLRSPFISKGRISELPFVSRPRSADRDPNPNILDI